MILFAWGVCFVRANFEGVGGGRLRMRHLFQVIPVSAGGSQKERWELDGACSGCPANPTYNHRRGTRLWGLPLPITGGLPLPITGGLPLPITGGLPLPITGGLIIIVINYAAGDAA
jgi:hypothetical protein